MISPLDLSTEIIMPGEHPTIAQSPLPLLEVHLI